MEQTLPKLKTNLDTNLLKLVAVVCMLLDHFGGTFFEQVPAFRWAGRLAFPLFCYCMTVGMPAQSQHLFHPLYEPADRLGI